MVNNDRIETSSCSYTRTAIVIHGERYENPKPKRKRLRLGPRERRAIEFIVSNNKGNVRTRELARALGIDKRRASDLVKRLVEKGVLRRVGRGFYEVDRDRASILLSRYIRKDSDVSMSARVDSAVDLNSLVSDLRGFLVLLDRILLAIAVRVKYLGDVYGDRIWSILSDVSRYGSTRVVDGVSDEVSRLLYEVNVMLFKTILNNIDVLSSVSNVVDVSSSSSSECSFYVMNVHDRAPSLSLVDIWLRNEVTIALMRWINDSIEPYILSSGWSRRDLYRLRRKELWELYEFLRYSVIMTTLHGFSRYKASGFDITLNLGNVDGGISIVDPLKGYCNKIFRKIYNERIDQLDPRIYIARAILSRALENHGDN